MNHPSKPDTEKIDTHFNRRRTRRLDVGETNPQDALDSEAVSYVPPLIMFVLTDGTSLSASTAREITLGRHSRPEDPSVSVDLHTHRGHENGVSRLHAMVAVSNNIMTVRDLGSVNGTHLNGMPLQPAKSYPLRHGDVLALGHLVLKVVFVD